MTWNDEDLADVMRRGQLAKPLGVHFWAPPAEALRAIMTRAVELVAARGGAMTADHLEHTLKNIGNPMMTGEFLRAHISAQGARLAAAEAERETLRVDWSREVDLRGQTQLALTEMRKERDAARVSAGASRDLLAKAEADLATARQLHGALILEASAQVSALEKEIAALKVESERRRQERYDALSAQTTEGLSAAEWQLRTGKAERENVGLRSQVETLTAAGAVLSAHVDKTAGETPSALALLSEEPSNAETIAHRDGFDTGAEAMRAACISDALEWARRNGYLNDFQMASLKGVLEGATP